MSELSQDEIHAIINDIDLDKISQKYAPQIADLWRDVVAAGGSAALGTILPEDNFDIRDVNTEDFIRSRRLGEKIVRDLDDFSKQLVNGIDNTTRTRLLGVFNQALADKSGLQGITEGLKDTFSGMEDWRAKMIARTETGYALQWGQVEGYAQAGLQAVMVSDGDGDEDCAAVDGLIISLEVARQYPLSHPNCVRSFLPMPGDFGPDDLDDDEFLAAVEKVETAILQKLEKSNPEGINQYTYGGGHGEEDELISDEAKQALRDLKTGKKIIFNSENHTDIPPVKGWKHAVSILRKKGLVPEYSMHLGPGPKRWFIYTVRMKSALAKRFDENQERDESGRWVSEGGGQNAIYDKESKTWKQKSGKDLPEHFQHIRIPPGWKNVRYSEDPNDDIHAVGDDSKGRQQTIYSKPWKEQQATAKFARIEELDKEEGRISSDVNRDIQFGRNKEEACALRLIMRTGLRPGGENDTGGAVKAYGATTLMGKHVVGDSPNNVRLVFVGKKGVALDIPVNDRAVARDLLARRDAAGPSGRIFNTTAGKVLDYTHVQDHGGFQTKDFRTLLGTRTAQEVVARMPAPSDEKTYKLAVKDVAKAVSAKLGNTPTVALQSYIHPVVFSKWLIGAHIGKFENTDLEKDWNEEDHPRGEDGKFIGGGSGVPKHQRDMRFPTKYGPGTKYLDKGRYCETDAARIEKGVPEDVLRRDLNEDGNPVDIFTAIAGPTEVDTPEGIVVNDYGERRGLCYEMAAKFVTDNPDWKVVHATLYPQIGNFENSVYFHGFAEKDNVVFDPVFNKFYDKGAYYKYYAITDARSFSVAQVYKQMSKTRRWGAWDAS
jgi:DNA topoisomerase-1